jgi:Family of unknown function (DUF5767)
MDSDIIDISAMGASDSWGPSETVNLKSSNFGGGLELLMNDKKTGSSSKSSGGDINIEDLTNLEDELNNLVDETSGPSLSFDTSRSFNFSDKPSSSSSSEKQSVRFSEEPSIGLGQSTAESDADNKTWDGYSKFNNIPINPDRALPTQPQMSKEELLREKFKFLRKLETLESKGVNLTKKYSMDSPLAEMQGEYEMIMEEKAKLNSIKFQGNMLMACINGIEFLNNRFDPFDIKLDGWSEQVNENMTDYDEIFGELYDKYKSRASMAPELKLLFQLGGSGMMIHMTNTMFKSAMPGMDDILRQNPDLMRQFQTAAVNSMGQSSPGFSGFMSGLMNPEPEVPVGRGPPPPMSTQGPGSMPPPVSRQGNNNYGAMSNNNARNMSLNGFSDGIDIRENYGNTSTAERSSRPEMRGPSDISDILSGLKTKTINISEEQMPEGNSSTISISDLKELQASGGNMPKRSKRRPKSDKNTVSLDI